MLIQQTCVFHPVKKTFLELKAFPKNKEAQPVFISDEILQILKRRESFKVEDRGFVFQVKGRPSTTALFS